MKKVYETPRLKGAATFLRRNVCFEGSLFGEGEGMSTSGGAYSKEDTEMMPDETGYW